MKRKSERENCKSRKERKRITLKIKKLDRKLSLKGCMNYSHDVPTRT